MSVETTLEDLATELGEAIADLPEYEAYESAKAAVEDSEAAQAEIREFEQERHEFMLARQSGEATEDDLRSLQRSQQELHDLPVMAEYLAAQEDLEDRLERLNEAISEPLAVDFGGVAGGCCND